MGQPRRRAQNSEGRDQGLVEVGARISEARRQLGIDQKELAKLLQVSDKAVSLWERGMNSPHRHINDLANILGKPEQWFWHGDTPEMKQEKILVELLRTNKTMLEQLRLLRIEISERDVPL